MRKRRDVERIDFLYNDDASVIVCGLRDLLENAGGQEVFIDSGEGADVIADILHRSVGRTGERRRSSDEGDCTVAVEV